MNIPGCCCCCMFTVCMHIFVQLLPLLLLLLKHTFEWCSLHSAVPVFLFFSIFYFFFHSVCAITEPSANLFAYYCNGSLSFLQQEKYGREKEKENPAIYFLRSAPIYMSNFIGGNKSGRVNNNNKFIRNEICTFTSTSIGLT